MPPGYIHNSLEMKGEEGTGGLIVAQEWAYGNRKNDSRALILEERYYNNTGCDADSY